MKFTHILQDNLCDPVIRGWMRSTCHLRTYQSEALRTIFTAAQRHEGKRFTVIFPRQSGKNETQAQLESAVMAANQHRGGSIIKLLPTEKNQGRISQSRLEKTLRGNDPANLLTIRRSGNKITYGSTEILCLSASPNASIVGATADLLLEVDEAQMVKPEKFDLEALPMAASTNAVSIFWGTAWDDQTLLARESRLASKIEKTDRSGSRHLFITDASSVGREVPAYAEFVRSQVENLGREHPAVRTQFFCEEISDLTSMFTPERIEAIRGTHQPLDGPEPDRCYVFLIDIAGSDEITAGSRRIGGFSDRRDATVITICEVFLPDEPDAWERGPVWKVAARRFYRNVPALDLEKLVSQEVEHWAPARIVLDHTGLGCMLSDYLSRRFPGICSAYDITLGNKTRMAWDFLSMVNTGRWQEYHTDDLEQVPDSAYRPGRDHLEILKDPVLLQRMFFRELRACRMEPTANVQVVRWGVPDGTRDAGNGKLIHDDLVMSAALSALEKGSLPLITKLPDFDPCYFDPVGY